MLPKGSIIMSFSTRKGIRMPPHSPVSSRFWSMLALSISLAIAFIRFFRAQLSMTHSFSTVPWTLVMIRPLLLANSSNQLTWKYCLKLASTFGVGTAPSIQMIRIMWGSTRPTRTWTLTTPQLGMMMRSSAKRISILSYFQTPLGCRRISPYTSSVIFVQMVIKCSWMKYMLTRMVIIQVSSSSTRIPHTNRPLFNSHPLCWGKQIIISMSV